MSTVGTAKYLDLVRQAIDGKLKLPAFQRDWKWRRKQVVELFDSLRNQYPIGSFLLAKADEELNLSPRSFKYTTDKADKGAPTQVVLDGQQRITAGIQLFYALSPDQGSHYFLDIEKLEKQFQAYATEKGTTVSAILDNDDAIKQFVKQIETDDGYIKHVNKVGDPYARLNSQHLLFTPLLLAERDKHLETYLDSYFEKYPSKKSFFRNVIKPHFQIADSPLVPFILIESTDVSGLSRIFTTLNTTGKLLTPFELVVAILFPQEVDLRVDIGEAKKLHPTYYPNMDGTGEIALQTCVLLADGDPKKSLLPKTLTKHIWLKNKLEAFKSLDRVGAFLRDQVGMPLSNSTSYTPYDSVFGPLAYAWSKTSPDALSPVLKKKAFDKLTKYVIGASLSSRYQEGVHNKQRADAKALVEWISQKEKEDKEPAWLKEVAIPSLKRVAPAGAIGKTILCLLNRRNLRDPITHEPVPLGSSEGEDHHFFPTKFVPGLPGWLKTTNSNVVLNIIRTTKTTNAEFLNADPRDQMQKAMKANSANLYKDLEDQGVSADCAKILLKPAKSAEDFEEFIRLREIEIRKLIKDEFQFPITEIEPEDGDV